MRRVNQKVSGIVVVFATLFGIGVPVLLSFVYETRLVTPGPDIRVITLTSVAVTGTWTEEEVNGKNYGRQECAPARPVLKVGETVLLRLKSADVVHSFYIPALNVGPLKVDPGHVVEIELKPTTEGVFQYYCTTFCGMPHFGMRGEVVVQGKSSSAAASALPAAGKYWLEPSPPPGAGPVERGKWLFRKKGCFTCHGQEGRGGVANWNYVKDTVPALNSLAEKLMLFDPEDVDTIVGEMERGHDLDSLVDSASVPHFNVFLAQCRSVRDVIRKGSASGKKDPLGPDPPLVMPAWGQRLSEADIDAIIAYLLTLRPGS